MTGGVRLRPGWTRVIVRVNWLVTPAALVATTVKALPPSASGTSKKANRPLGFDCRDGAGLLEGHGHVGVGLADEGHGGVGRHAVADRRGVGVDVEVEGRLRGRRGRRGGRGVEAVVARQDDRVLVVDLAVAVDVGGQAVVRAPGGAAHRRGEQGAVVAVDVAVAVEVARHGQVEGVVAGRRGRGPRDRDDVQAGLVDREQRDDGGPPGVDAARRAGRRSSACRGRGRRSPPPARAAGPSRWPSSSSSSWSNSKARRSVLPAARVLFVVVPANCAGPPRSRWM